MLERDVGGEESDEGGLGIEAEGVVVQIDGVEFGKGEEGGKEGREGLGNFI